MENEGRLERLCEGWKEEKSRTYKWKVREDIGRLDSINKLAETKKIQDTTLQG